MDTLGERLAFLRVRAKLEQEDLAEVSGLDQGTISKLEHDKQPQSIKLLRAMALIAEKLQADLIWIATGVHGAPPIQSYGDKYPGREAAVNFARICGYSEEAVKVALDYNLTSPVGKSAREWFTIIEHAEERLMGLR